MTTNTDTSWTNRLASVMPDNFMSNLASSYTANAGYLDTMINRIGMTVVSSVDNPYNPFAKYTSQVMDYGDTVQKYKTKYIAGQEFNPDDANPFVTVKNKPIAQYATLNDSVQYQDTVTQYEFKKAFTSEAMLGDFISSKLDSIYQSDALDKYTKWKKYLSNKDIMGANEIVAVDSSDDMVYAENLIKAFRKYANSKFRQPNTSYNVSGDTAISADVDIIMKADDRNLIDEYLKGVYNLDKVKINANMIYIDDFATVTGAPDGTDGLSAIIADSRAFQYYPRTPEAGSIYNPKGLAINYYLTIQGTYCADKFRNVVGIYKEASA